MLLIGSTCNRQNPQCIGKHASRFLFNKLAPSHGRILYRVLVEESKKSLFIEAGQAQGITKGARFAAFTSRNVDEKPIGLLVAAEVGAASARLVPDSNSDTKGVPIKAIWVLQTAIGENSIDVAIAVPSRGSAFHPIIERVVSEMKKESPGANRIQLVGRETHHEIAISEGDDRQVVFDITDTTCVSFGLRRLAHSVQLSSDASKLYSVFGAASDFFHHLRRSNKRAPLANVVNVEAYLLEEYYPDSASKYMGEPDFRPEGESLVDKDGIMIPEHVYEEDSAPINLLRLAIDRQRYYGFKISSKLNQALYVWILAFDMNK
jgi:hypothetical protein